MFHLAAWGRVGLRSLSKMIRTTNRFDRQVEVCRGSGLNFRSFDGVIGAAGGIAESMIHGSQHNTHASPRKDLQLWDITSSEGCS